MHALPLEINDLNSGIWTKGNDQKSDETDFYFLQFRVTFITHSLRAISSEGWNSILNYSFT